MSTHIYDLFKYDTHVSFEFFPPKTNQGRKQIYQAISKLKGLNPDFFSVTYGAGGSTAERSLEIASALTNLAQVTCVAHITCVGMNRNEVKELLTSLEFHGISNVLALRGDPPKGETRFIKPVDGFSYASELVRFIRENSDMGILVAGYPEGHLESPNKKEDFKYLLEKINAGANGIITQLFFVNQYLFEFQNNLRNAGVNIPLIAGIFPISNAKQIKRMTELSGATIPEELLKDIEKHQDSSEDVEKIGTDFAVRQVEELLRGGITHFHFYTMNRHQQTRNILFQLKRFFPRLNFL